MEIQGDYNAQGYAWLKGLIPAPVARRFLAQIRSDLENRGQALRAIAATTPLIRRYAYELYCRDYPPMLTFLWALTPTISQIVGRPLLPTYSFFRVYLAGDVCRVHADRPACEHSLSLTLGYADGRPWPLEIEASPVAKNAPQIAENFGEAASAAAPMQPGDAVLYRGVEHRHGRTTPNPNRWSAHMFLHWVDPDGPHKDHAFDGDAAPPPPDFAPL